MSHYAGLDWSGTPYLEYERTVDLYVACYVVTDDLIFITAGLRDLRSSTGHSADHEFHGHACTERELIQVLEFIYENISVTAMLLDKRRIAARNGLSLFSTPAALAPAAALAATMRTNWSEPPKTLYCDEDISKGYRPGFNKAFRHLAGARWPNSRIDIKHMPSNKSDLIQLADIAAYALQRAERNSFKTKNLQILARSLWERSGNEIRWGDEDDLRPYLMLKT